MGIMIKGKTHLEPFQLLLDDFNVENIVKLILEHVRGCNIVCSMT